MNDDRLKKCTSSQAEKQVKQTVVEGKTEQTILDKEKQEIIVFMWSLVGSK